MRLLVLLAILTVGCAPRRLDIDYPCAPAEGDEPLYEHPGRECVDGDDLTCKTWRVYV